MDRAYIDFIRLYVLTQHFAFFVIRAKTNFQFRRLYSYPIDKSTGLRCDQTIVLTGVGSSTDYPDKLRRIRYFDSDNDMYFTFLTNNFMLPAITIAQLYKCRWQIELFFKWIKQHLKINKFYSTSENGALTQIYTTLITYCLVFLYHLKNKFDSSLWETFQNIATDITNGCIERACKIGVALLGELNYKERIACYEEYALAGVPSDA